MVALALDRVVHVDQGRVAVVAVDYGVGVLRLMVPPPERLIVPPLAVGLG